MARASSRRIPWQSRVLDGTDRTVPVYREGLRFFRRLRRWDRFATWEERFIVKAAAIAAFPAGLWLGIEVTRWLWDQWAVFSRPGRTPEVVRLLFDVLPAVLIAAPTFAAVFYVFAPVMNRAIARGWVSEGRCGSCGYELGAGSPEGTRRCSECGAAWRVSISPPTTGQVAEFERMRGIIPRLAATGGAGRTDVGVTPMPDASAASTGRGDAAAGPSRE